MNNNLLEIRNLSVEYKTDDAIIYAVNNISLSVKKGETIGLVGETGAGKTTIAKSVLQVLPSPQAKLKSGEIIFNGEDLLKLSYKKCVRSEAIKSQ
jgi:peptide/nickel transport system ATP-binding protein